MSERDVPKRLGPVETLVVAFVCLFLLAVVLVCGRKSRFDAYRITCNNNLSLIGKAMLAYANDYNSEFPRSAGRNSRWATSIPDWLAASRLTAYGIATDGSGGQGTISSCLYLLVKYEGVAPKTFVCPGEVGTTEFNPTKAGAGDKDLIDLWDFGPQGRAHCSYAYHMPFGLYALNIAYLPGMAVAADRNPWIDSPAGEAKEIKLFNPEGARDAVKAGNAIAHDHEGQNVLFLDGHVAFEDHSFCGLDDDNIYTFWDGGDVRRGAAPVIGASNSKDRTDSFLVNDKEPHKPKLVVKQPERVNSADLKQTAIVPTLDCPLPEHKNVIWCSTFQMTWDKLKKDIIGEPIKVSQAAEMAARLNQAEFSPRNLEAESFYAAVGMVERGIVQQIQKEMGRRFPSEPVPVFGKLDALPAQIRAKTIVSYSFLRTDLAFKYPFYTEENAFAFEDSSGQCSNVTSFCDYTKGEDPNKDLVREQVDILYYKYADQAGAAEFAVDLCRHTNPYQVVLALVPKTGTLSEIMNSVEQKVSEFKNDPDYEILCKLRAASGNRPADKLIVPDVLYKLTHHFTDLEGKGFDNERWQSYYILEAMQVIDFALSRTGVELKSEARLIAPPFASRLRQLQEPRYFYFNKPFLIYVKKRGPAASPFFAMWVDNSELMKKF